MPREYQPKRNNPYYIDDRDIHMQMVYMIRNYPKLRARRERLLYGSPAPSDGQPRGNGTTNPTEQKALVLATINGQIEAVEQVIIDLQGKYSRTCTGEPFDAYEAFMDYGVFCYYRSKPGKDEAPCERTWKYYRTEFTYKLAKKLNYI